MLTPKDLPPPPPAPPMRTVRDSGSEAFGIAGIVVALLVFMAIALKDRL